MATIPPNSSVTEISADDMIRNCLSLDSPRSFFLFAGAGSGKTRSLVTVLKAVRDEHGKRLKSRGQHIAVITYTNAACDEIIERMDFDPLLKVSTIHSFVWELIKNYHSDIKKWLRISLTEAIHELQQAQAKGRASKAAEQRTRKIESKTRRLARLDSIKQFTYSPNGDNRGRDSLNHTEVIQIAADFLMHKPLMQRILISQYPALLIDESQDTSKQLMEAFLALERQHRRAFSLGLFGDTMQRIYSDGKFDLGKNLPPDWLTPAKKVNYRCPQRVVRLINRVRSAVDNQEQVSTPDKEEGFVRLFILPGNFPDKPAAESRVMQRMMDITQDPLWGEPLDHVKTLMLEHHMAAKRMGFLPLFEPLYLVDEGTLRTSLLNGSLAGLRLFSELVLPVVLAKLRGDEFAVSRVVRKHSPLLQKDTLKSAGKAQPAQIKRTREAVAQLVSLWDNDADPSFIAVLRVIAQTGLFEVPESIQPIAFPSETEEAAIEEEKVQSRAEDKADGLLEAWEQSLATPFSQIKLYKRYVEGNAAFDTHQGVKGREFPRVLVVMDDTEARGFLFQYEKLFGALAKTKTDIDNERDGKDSGPARTRRLFYVTCSRAEKSLALVAYSADPAKVKDHVLKEGWFEKEEVEIFS